MNKSLSLLKFLKQLSKERDYTLTNLNEVDFSLFFDEFPENNSYISFGSLDTDYILRIKRPFSSKTFEDRKIQEIFKKLKEVYYALENETKDLELIIGNAILESKYNKDIRFPILTKVVNLFFDAKKDIIEVRDTLKRSRLDIKLLSKIDNINPLEIKRSEEELIKNYVNPLITKESHDYLMGLAKRLHIEGSVSKEFQEDITSSFNLVEKNVLILVPKIDSKTNFYDALIEKADNGYINKIIKTISGEEKISHNLPEDDSTSILFTKEYNNEQVNIVLNANVNEITLVDGPPGSGKTHTVSNMIGHYLAKGKRILVLSKKKRALKVLKNMVDPHLYGLLVSKVTNSNEDINETLYYINQFLSNHTALELSVKRDKLAKDRDDLIRRMVETENGILNILESENKSIYYDNEELSLVEACKFVNENEKYENIIPGEIKYNTTFPLTKDDVDFYYKSNSKINIEEETKLQKHIPNIEKLITPQELEEILERLDKEEFKLMKYSPYLPNFITINDKGVTFEGNVLEIGKIDPNIYDELEKLSHYLNLEKWEEEALKVGLNLVDKKAFGELSRLALEVDKFREKNIDIITGRTLEVPNLQKSEIEFQLKELYKVFSKKERLGVLDTLFRKNRKEILESLKINGKVISNCQEVEEALILLNYYDLLDTLKSVYNELIGYKNGPDFADYFKEKDRIFMRITELYNFKDLYLPLLEKLYALLPEYVVNKKAPARSNPNKNVLSYLAIDIFNLLKTYEIVNNNILPLKKRINDFIEYLSDFDEEILTDLKLAISNNNLENYRLTYEDYKNLVTKLPIAEKRKEILEKLKSSPTYREFLEKRLSIHASDEVPEHLALSWKVKVLKEEVQKIVNEPYEKLRKMLSWYRKSIIASNIELAKTNSWMHFLKKMEDDPTIRQTIKGLELTVKKIGKGLGKESLLLKQKADELFYDVQKYIPCWMMTLDEAFETLTPDENFDVVIIDEASTADITHLPLVYFGKKVIIIGDDKQTTPLMSSISTERVNNLKDATLSDDFPNYHLYEPTTSFYDILKATFPSFLLTEEFRSVPEIIDYSNKLIYDGKISPLRDINDSHLKPALNICYVDGEKIDGVNVEEKDQIIKKVKEIIADEKYDGKTIGIISLAGENQAKLIDEELSESIDSIEYDSRRILCGTPNDFQGDERDVILISMVDSPEDKPLKLLSDGFRDSNKKKFNVCFSRAKDQEFLFTSLKKSDLKTGDLRLFTIEYFEEAYQEKRYKNKLTPFEEIIKEELTKRDMTVEIDHKAGNLPLSLVVQPGNVCVLAVSEDLLKSREDFKESLYKGLTLERVGWKLSHIRESKFTLYREKALEELIESIKSKR